jgi:tRNA-2-methylthio-N6-dimethylallyladenosine synthase
MKYRIITYGCQMNISDSEKIAVLLQKQGHKPAKNEREAGLIVLNCCSVRQAAMHRVYDKINKNTGKKKVILAGCILEKDKNALKEKVGEIWHPDEYFECLPFYNDKKIAYVPIMTGCNNFCSYCAVPYTRGREKSRPAGKIINEVKSLLKKGYKEIMLLGQNVNSYKDGKTNFLKILKKINDLNAKFKLSFMTSHPKDMSDELIATMAKCDKLKRELHLPIQSGDNEILRKMNRHYTTSHYKNLIKKIRAKIKGIKISTDIIVGFPGETEKQFQNSVKLARAVKFDKAFIAKYSPRPGTAAAKLKDDVPVSEKKRRWKILDTLINKFKH